MLIHALWGGVVWSPCRLCTLPALAMLLLKSLFLMLSMQTTVLSLHSWSLIPPVHLHTHIVMMRLDPYRDTYTLAFVFWFPPFCPLLPSAFFHLLFTYIYPPPPPAVRVHHGELASSFPGLLHQVCTTLWALKALLAAALTEMNVVYLCNAQQVTQHIRILCALGRISHFIHHSQLAAAISQSQSLSINT